MTIDDKIWDEKLQRNREAAKVSASSSRKIGKYECLTGEEILPSNQRQKIEHANLAYSPLGKAFEKQTKTIDSIKATEDLGKQLVESNELIKKDFNIHRDSIPLEEQNKYLMNLLNNDVFNLGV